MKRITEKDLQNMVDIINKHLTTKVQLSGAYGGWKIEQEGTYKDVLSCGFISKPKLYDLLTAYYRGLTALD